MMQMSFEFTSRIHNLLFYGWTSSSVGGLVGACFAMAGFAILLEGTKVLTYTLSDIASQPPQPTSINLTHRPPNIIDTSSGSEEGTVLRKLKFHTAQTLVHVLRLIVGYFLMLGVMTYNAWFLIATAVGSALGYFLFGTWRRLVPDSADRETESPSRVSDTTSYPESYQRTSPERELLED